MKRRTLVSINTLVSFYLEIDLLPPIVLLLRHQRVGFSAAPPRLEVPGRLGASSAPPLPPPFRHQIINVKKVSMRNQFQMRSLLSRRNRWELSNVDIAIG
jgi:hypothetical protein